MSASSRLVTVLRSLLALAGLVLLAFGTKATMDGLASREWDAVSGSWDPDLPGVYRYRVADSVYAGSREQFGAIPALSALPPSAGAADRAGGSSELLEVHYDPSNPSESVLHAGVQRSALLFAGGGVLLLALAAFPSGDGKRRPAAERSLRAEGLIPPTFQQSDPNEELGWSGRSDLDGRRQYRG